MEDSRIAPKPVMDKAIECGMNTAKYLGLYKDYEVWGIYDVDEEGSVVPTGLPCMILYNEDGMELAYGEKAFQIFDAIGL